MISASPSACRANRQNMPSRTARAIFSKARTWLSGVSEGEFPAHYVTSRRLPRFIDHCTGQRRYCPRRLLTGSARSGHASIQKLLETRKDGPDFLGPSKVSNGVDDGVVVHRSVHSRGRGVSKSVDFRGATEESNGVPTSFRYARDFFIGAFFARCGRMRFRAHDTPSWARR